MHDKAEMNGREERILRSLRRISRAVDLYSRKLAGSHQLTGPQLVVLRQLRVEGPQAPGRLAKTVSLSHATITGIVDRLESRGLVVRTRRTDDRRRVDVALTELGADTVQRAPSPLQERLAKRLAALPEAEQRRLEDTLGQIVEMMEARDLAAAPHLTAGDLDADADDVREFLSDEG